VDLRTHGITEVEIYNTIFHESEKSQDLVIFFLHGLAEVIFYNSKFHEFEKFQHLVIFFLHGLMEVIFYDFIFHESIKSQHLVVFPFVDPWRWDYMILTFMSKRNINT